MCGIAGLFDYSASPHGDHRGPTHGNGAGGEGGDARREMTYRVARMVDAVRHRGPDEAGCHADGPFVLGHARLSIIDVLGGRQPLFSEDGAVAVVCNGEIYNHRELRAGLEQRGHRFATRSDTEVVVHLYEELGEGC